MLCGARYVAGRLAVSSSDHPPFAHLTDLVQDRLDPGERGRLDSHVSTCGQCASSVVWLERVISVMRAGALEEPPLPAVSRATRLLRLRITSQQPGPSLVRRILAVLSFDTAQPLSGMALGLRSSEQPTLRQMMFTAEDRHIQLRVRSAPHGWLMVGQVLGSCDHGGRAELRGPNMVEVELNEVCEFSLPEVPSGVYSLLLRLGDADIEVPDLALGV
jgi:anti-sigma factor RsiW